MSSSTLLPNIATILTLLFGLAAIAVPQTIASAVAWTLKGARGSAELRIGIGGLIVGLCAYALYAQNAAIFTALGFMYVGIAATRVLSIALDRPKLNASYIITLIVEIVLAVMLFL